MNKEEMYQYLAIRLNEVEQEIVDSHPILKYRINHFAEGINVRGIKDPNHKKCGLVLDDSIIAGKYHFPCVIYMREKGNPIGEVGPNMRNERFEWFKKHDCYKDDICRNNCLDVCCSINKKIGETNEFLKPYYNE
jgi:hypothetical protein